MAFLKMRRWVVVSAAAAGLVGCGHEVIGGGSGGAGGDGGGAQAGGSGGQAQGGEAGAPPSPCPTPSIECCEALDDDACNIKGDSCRRVSYGSYKNENTCSGIPNAGCFYVNPSAFPPEVESTGTSPGSGTGTGTGTDVGANSRMWRQLPDGSFEAGFFGYFQCGAIYGWTGCSSADAPPVCSCVPAIGC